MNNHMYEHPATQANLDAPARARGPRPGARAPARWAPAGEWGIGRLRRAARAAGRGGGRRPRRRAAAASTALRVLVTAGGTREPIDSVRYVGNRSSGRMGFALADEAARRGAEVTVVAANVTLAAHPRVAYVDVETAAELARPCAASASPAATSCSWPPRWPTTGPPAPAAEKLKKDRAERLELELERTEDVLVGPGRRAAPRPDAGRLRRRARRGRARARRAASSSARAWTPSWSTTSRARDIGFDAARQRGHDRHGGGGDPRPLRGQAGGGGRRSSTRSRACAPASRPREEAPREGAGRARPPRGRRGARGRRGHRPAHRRERAPRRCGCADEVLGTS